MSDLMQYDELVQRHDAAYSAFETIYSAKNPPPTLRQVNVSWWDLAALFLLVLASIAVSGSRTIPEFGGGVIGWAAFLMLEVAMIAYAYWRAEEAGRKAQLKLDTKAPTNRLTLLGIGMSFTVILSANLHHTLLEQGLWIPPWVNTTIYVALAISAPSLALIAGDRFGNRFVLIASLRKEARLEHEIQLAEWRAGLNRSWASQQSKWGVRLEVLPNPLPIPSNGNPLEAAQPAELPAASTLGHRKVPQATSIAETYFQAHPEHINTPCETLVPVIGVGKSTINAVQKRLRAQQS